MATKDPLLFKDKQNIVIDNGQYNNFALNNNHQISSDAFSGRSKSVATERRKILDYDFTNDSQTKKEFHSWKKSTKNLSPCVVNNGFGKEDRLKNGNALSASTLSLYIEGYENSSEVNFFDVTKEGLKKNDLIKKGFNAKQIDFDSTLVIQNAFEFSRQQENGGAVTPEIAQYRASQRLFNPNLQTHQASVHQIEMSQDTDDGEPESTSSSETEVKAPLLEDVGVLDAPPWSVEGAFDPNDIGKSMSQRLCHWGPLLAIFLIVTIGMSTTIVFFHIWPPMDSLMGFLNLLLFFSWNYMSLTNFLQATRFGGGYVKLGWTPEDPAVHKKLQYCPLCEGHKAPRSHHCARCNRCVLKMDHHCPWLNNCVGHRNHALFIKFCFFSILGCFHSTVFLIKSVVVTIYLLYYADKTSRVLPQDLPITDIQTMIAALTGATLSLGVCVAVIPLLYIQLWSVYHNMTYIEDYIVSKADARRRYEKIPFVYPYNLGWRRNLLEVLANGTFPKGNGIWWPIRADCTQFTFSEEQIAQKQVKSRHARIRTIAIGYNGGIILGTLRLGWYSFFCQPLTDGRRVEVKAGEKWAITRGSKFWVYAKKVEKQSYVDSNGTVQYEFVGTDHMARGWFPRVCLEVAKTE